MHNNNVNDDDDYYKNKNNDAYDNCNNNDNNFFVDTLVFKLYLKFLIIFAYYENVMSLIFLSCRKER